MSLVSRVFPDAPPGADSFLTRAGWSGEYRFTPSVSEAGAR
jgi:hypothetical protein